MGPGLMSGRTAAWGALWLIRHGFRYVPMTYTGIAFLNFIPFFAHALIARSELRRIRRSVPVASIPTPSTNKKHCSINGAPFFRLTAVNHYPDNDCVESDIHEPER